MKENTIKEGMVIKFKVSPNKGNIYNIGVVIEILEIKDSVDKERIGKNIYFVDELNNTSFPVRIIEEQIIEVYGKVDWKGIE